jgi:hypothetical protein
LQAEDRGELTYDQFSLAIFLCGIADYRTHMLEIEIMDLKSRMRRTRHSDDKIRRDLHALKSGKWINFDVEQRQRAPWVIRLTGLLVREREGASAANSPASLRQSTAADGLPQTHSDENEERDSDARELPHARNGPSISISSAEEDYVLGEGTKGNAEPVSFSLEGLTAEARASVERKRAQEAGIDFEYFGTARLDEIEDAYREEER